MSGLPRESSNVSAVVDNTENDSSDDHSEPDNYVLLSHNSSGFFGSKPICRGHLKYLIPPVAGAATATPLYFLGILATLPAIYTGLGVTAGLGLAIWAFSPLCKNSTLVAENLSGDSPSVYNGNNSHRGSTQGPSRIDTENSPKLVVVESRLFPGDYNAYESNDYQP